MITLARIGLCRGAAFLMCTAAAQGQSLNIDIGTSAGAPSSGHGAASGSSGAWNVVSMSGPKNSPIPLSGLSGAGTSVTIEYNSKGNGNHGFDNPLTSGDDEALLDDACDVGGNAASKVKYTFRGLCRGAYDVYAYAWSPDNPTAMLTDVECVGGNNGIQTCGGADWTGAHVLGETFVTDTVELRLLVVAAVDERLRCAIVSQG